MGRKAHPLAARIKKMMQTDDDVGKIAQATPVMIARAMELFLQRLCNNAADVAAGRKAKTLTTSHLKAYVSSDELMDFLQDTVSKAPDLPAEGEPEQPKPKRQRTEAKRDARTSAEGKRASADGAAAAAAAAAAQPAEDEEPAAAAAPAAPVKPEESSSKLVKHEQVKQEHAKQEDTGSPSAQAAHAKLGQGFGGLGAHPFLTARGFGKAGAAGLKRRAGSSSSPKPASPAHKAAAAAAAEGSPAAEGAAAADAAGAQQQQQPAGQQAAGDAAAGLPGLPGMLSVQALARFQQQDDFDEDYDS